jgi:hypothetical protein
MSLLGTFGKGLDVFPKGFRLGDRVGPGIKLVVYARVVGTLEVGRLPGHLDWAGNSWVDHRQVICFPPCKALQIVLHQEGEGKQGKQNCYHYKINYYCHSNNLSQSWYHCGHHQVCIQV